MEILFSCNIVFLSLHEIGKKRIERNTIDIKDSKFVPMSNKCHKAPVKTHLRKKSNPALEANVRHHVIIISTWNTSSFQFPPISTFQSSISSQSPNMSSYSS